MAAEREESRVPQGIGRTGLDHVIQTGKGVFVVRARRFGSAGQRFCYLAGGECTVTLHGTGRGGRNQEMALAAALHLRESGDGRVTALFAGTDGTDGPTDAAGGFAAGAALAGREAEARDLLEQNDSYTALERAGLLLRTGPTLTNVMDMAILCVESQTAEKTA